MSNVPTPTTAHMDTMWSIVATVHHQVPEADSDDLAQELWVKWYQDYEALRPYVEDEDTARGQRLLYRALLNCANAYAAKERAAIRGYKLDDLYFYNKATLRELLPHIHDAESFSSFAVQGEKVGRSTKPAHEGGDALAFYADLTSAFWSLPMFHRQLLSIAYINPPDNTDEGLYEAIAQWLQVDIPTARKRVERSVTALQRALGGPKPPDRRKVMSNAAAIHDTRSEFDGN